MSRLTSSTLRVGDSSPPLVLPTRDGELVDLAALLDLGSVLLIFVPGTWSPNTRHQLEALEHAHEKFQAIGVVPVVVATQDQGRLSKALMHSTPSFLILSDETRDVARDYGVYRAFSWNGIGVTSPSLFLIGRDARVRLIYVGDRDADVPDLDTVLHLANLLVGEVAEEAEEALPTPTAGEAVGEELTEEALSDEEEALPTPTAGEAAGEELTEEAPSDEEESAESESAVETGEPSEPGIAAEDTEIAAAEEQSLEGSPTAAIELILEDESEPEAMIGVGPNGGLSEPATAESPLEQGEREQSPPENGTSEEDSQVETPSTAAGMAGRGPSSDPRSS